MSTTTEKVEYLVQVARSRAAVSGSRQRVEAFQVNDDPRWYYQVRSTGRWPRQLFLGGDR